MKTPDLKPAKTDVSDILFAQLINDWHEEQERYAGIFVPISFPDDSVERQSFSEQQNNLTK